MLYAPRVHASAAPADSPASLFLAAEWRSLLMINYAVDAEVLRPLVPAGLELDLWEGQALVSMVGFLFLRTRILGLPVPFHRNFEEINLRLYVRRQAAEGWRRGVTFVREIVPRRAIAWLARSLYNEPYVACPMRHQVDGGRREFGWYQGGRWNHLAAEVRGEPAPLAPGSPEEFIFEHYWGYTRQRDGGTVEYQVEHPRWRTWEAMNPRLDCEVVAPALYGERLAAALRQPPVSAFVAEGSAVGVRWARVVKSRQ
ncbi:MAG TPA: DUF2071 domain-containing protein [Chthoniobacter sp.]|jgi:hypothetical protein